MTPLELTYPLIGLIFALGGGSYAWQTRRNFAQATADLQAQQKALSESKITLTGPVVTPMPPPSEDVLHIQGKLRHLEQDLQRSQTTLQAALADRDKLSHNYQAQEKVVATLRHQLTQQQMAEGDRLRTLQQQNQELLQENSNLSDRLRQSVNSLAEARPKLVQLQALETKNQHLTKQLQQVNHDQQSALAEQLAEREKIWQQQHQSLTAQINGLEQQIQQLTHERDQAQQNLSNLQHQGESAQAQVKTLEASLQQLTQAQQGWQKEEEKLTAKLNNLENTQKALALTNQELTIKLETTQTQGDRLKAEKKEQGLALQIAQVEVAKLQRQLAEVAEAQAKLIAEPPLIPELEVLSETASAAVETITEPEPIADQVETVTPEAPVVEAVAQPESAVEIELEPIGKPELVKAEVKEESPPEPIPDHVNTPATATIAIEAVSEPVIESAPESTVNPQAVGIHLLTDKKVVILGTLNSMNREAAKARLQDLGAECTSAPSSKTDYVVVGKAPGVKLKKAQKLGIPQLSEAQFLELLGN